jgi:NADH:ubiquinone oxidoreductase subunit 3 (subunit A)
VNLTKLAVLQKKNMCIDILLCSGLCWFLGNVIYFAFANILNYAERLAPYAELLYLYDYYECGPKQITANSAHFTPACVMLFGFFVIYDLELLYLLLFVLNMKYLTYCGWFCFISNLIFLMGYFYFELSTNNLIFYI